MHVVAMLYIRIQSSVQMVIKKGMCDYGAEEGQMASATRGCTRSTEVRHTATKIPKTAGYR